MNIFSINGNVICQLNMMHVQNFDSPVHRVLGKLVKLLKGCLRLDKAKYFLHTILHIELSEFLVHLIMEVFEDLIFFYEPFNH